MADPIAPTNYSIAPAGIAPTDGIKVPAVTAPPSTENDLKVGFDLARKSGDPKVLVNFAQQARGTEYGQEAALGAQVVQKNQDEFDRLVQPIASKGGPDTPEGRLAAMDTWKTVGDDPKFGTWLVRYLMKDPNARVYAGLGNIKKEIEYGKNGEMIQVGRNELGEIAEVKNLATGKMLAPTEYNELKSALGVGKVITEEREKSKAKFNAEARNVEDAQINAYSAFADKLNAAGQGVLQIGDALVKSGVKPKNVAELVAFGNQSLSESRSNSELIGKLGSLTKGEGASRDIEQIKKVAAQLGYPDVVSVKADGTLVRKNGETVSETKLKQEQEQKTASSAFENATTGNQQQRAMGKLFKSLSVDQQQAVLRLVDLQSNMTNDYNRLRSEVGDLRFLVNLNDLDPLRGFGATMAKGESMVHNAKMIQEYAASRAEQLKVFDSRGQNPNAGEMQAAFTRTSGYQTNADNLTKKINQYLDFDITEKSAEEKGKAAAAAAKPAKAVAKPPPEANAKAKPEVTKPTMAEIRARVAAAKAKESK